MLSSSSPKACVGKHSWPELGFCSDFNRGRWHRNPSTCVFICDAFSGPPKGRDPRVVSLSGFISIIFWEQTNNPYGKQSLNWLPVILTLQWIFMCKCSPCCPLSVGRPSVLLLMNRIWQKWWDFASKVRLQKAYAFHLYCYLLCTFSLSTCLGKQGAMSEVALWDIHIARNRCLWPTASKACQQPHDELEMDTLSPANSHQWVWKRIFLQSNLGVTKVPTNTLISVSWETPSQRTH